MTARHYKDLVLKHLEHDPLTTQIAWHKWNMTQLPVIIHRLRNDGYPIRTIDQYTKDGTRYAKYVLLTGTTERCPHCGAIYDVAEIESRESEPHWEYEGMLDCYHACPCCEEIIVDEPQPDPDYKDSEELREIEEREQKEYDEMIAELNREYWRSR